MYHTYYKLIINNTGGKQGSSSLLLGATLVYLGFWWRWMISVWKDSHSWSCYSFSWWTRFGDGYFANDGKKKYDIDTVDVWYSESCFNLAMLIAK